MACPVTLQGQRAARRQRGEHRRAGGGANCLDINVRQAVRLKNLRGPNALLLPCCCECALGVTDVLVDIAMRGQGAKRFDRDTKSRRFRYRIAKLAQCSAMLFDVCNVSLNRLIECDALSAEDQFMQLLSMLGFDRQARADVLIYEGVVKDSNVVVMPVPAAVLEHGLRRASRAGNHNMGLIWRTQPVPLVDVNGIARRQRANDGGERRLAAAILCVANSYARERNVRSGGRGVEQPNISE